MQVSNKPIANPTVLLREEFDDWAILFHPDTADALGINPIGVVVWKQMNGRRNLEDIVAVVKDHFNDVPNTALDDIKAFVDSLAEQGFVGYGVETTGV